MNKCTNGYLSASRKHFWKYSDGETPAVADVLTSDNRLYVVFSLEVLENHRESPATYAWQTANWTATFVNHAESPVAMTSFGIMKDPNVLVLHAPLPRSVSMSDPGWASHVDLSAQLQDRRVHTYSQVPFCLTPAAEVPNRPLYQAAACVKSVPSEPWIHQLPEWIVYHIEQGFQHIYLYSVGDPTRMHDLMSPFVRIGWVTIVDWDWPEKWVQRYLMSESHQNACLLRARGVAEWIAFADVDEFWQPQMKRSPPEEAAGDFLTITETLRHPDVQNESALRADTWNFGRSSNDTAQLAISEAAGNLTIAKWMARDGDAIRTERWKNIVRPEAIRYMGTHLVATGPREYMLDPVKQMRVVHFKPHLAFEQRDESMKRYVHGVRSILHQFGY